MKKIFCYVILVCMFLMLVACGKKDSEKAFDEKVKEIKEQVTKSGEEGLESTKLVAKIFNKATYKVNKVEENGDSAQLDVSIKAVNLGRYLDELSAHLENTASAESTDEEINKIEGKWEIENPGDLYIGLYGGQGQVTDLPAQN